MGSDKCTPVITKRDFDAIEASLRAELKAKYDASKADSDRPPPNPATQGAFDHAPDLDSKTVATWSADVKKYLGSKFDPNLIRKGGYASFEDFWAEMSPRLRASCRDTPATTTSTLKEGAP